MTGIDAQRGAPPCREGALHSVEPGSIDACAVVVGVVWWKCCRGWVFVVPKGPFETFTQRVADLGAAGGARVAIGAHGVTRHALKDAFLSLNDRKASFMAVATQPTEGTMIIGGFGLNAAKGTIRCVPAHHDQRWIQAEEAGR